MRKFILLMLFFIGNYSFSIAQNTTQSTNGTIKVEKKNMVVQVYYDNVNYRLVGIDQYGNVLDSAIREFEMKTTIKGIAYAEKTVGSFLTYEMQKIIGRCDGSCSLLFTNITVKDKFGNIIPIKPYTYTFGNKIESGSFD